MNPSSDKLLLENVFIVLGVFGYGIVIIIKYLTSLAFEDIERGMTNERGALRVSGYYRTMSHLMLFKVISDISLGLCSVFVFIFVFGGSRIQEAFCFFIKLESIVDGKGFFFVQFICSTCLVSALLVNRKIVWNYLYEYCSVSPWKSSRQSS